MKEQATGRIFDSARFTSNLSECASTRRSSMWPVFFFIAAASVLGTCVSTAVADPPTEGLVAYWSFDDGTAHDDSGNGHDGTIHGATPCSGACGGGMSFDGIDDSIAFGDLGATAYSFCAWLKPTETIAPDDSPDTLASFSDSGLYCRALMLGEVTSSLDGETITLFDDHPGDPRTGVLNLEITTVWHFICVVWNEGAARYDIYYDGIAHTVYDSPSGGHVGLLAATNFVLGEYVPTSAGHFLDGCLDEVCVYNRSLSEQEVFALYEECWPHPMVLVPGGEFQMGDSFDEGDADELPVHTVFLSPYYIDKYEVTNQQYADELNWAYGQGLIDDPDLHGGEVQDSTTGTVYCDTADSSSESRITWNSSTFGVVAGKEDHPMVMVSWAGSAAYCNWRSAMEGKPPCYDLSTWTCDFGVAGYRLPTEAEWEKAAGWDPTVPYPFRFGENTDGCGTDCLDGQRANYYVSGDPFDNGTTPVGYYDGTDHSGAYQTQNAQSYYGCYDMSGNLWEWCHDWYASSYYNDYPPDGWPPNPTGPAPDTDRVMRGGGWGNNPNDCRSAVRHWRSPSDRHNYIGFRCALATLGAGDINCEDLTGFDFGAIPAGLCSAEHIWTVTNEGTGLLTGSITLEGADPNEFAFTQGDGAFSLDPTESRIVGLRFCPTSTGTKSATLGITSNDPDPDENPCDLALVGTGTPPWWNLDWGYRKQIIIDHTQVADDLVSFPVLVSHTSADLSANVAQTDGSDIAFADDSASKLNHEVELYNDGTGELIAWINMPSLSTSVDTILYVYYGNAACQNQENVTDTWDADYLAVWHMTDNSAGTAVDDSTSYANTANKVHTPTEVMGKIGYCQDLERTEADYLQATTATSPIVAGTGKVTFEGWMNRDNMGEWHSLFYEWGTPGGTDNELGGIFASDANHYDKASMSVCHGTYKSNLYSTSVVPAGEWTYIVGTYDSTTQRIYFNGSQEGSQGLSAAMNNGVDWYPLIGVKENYESPMNGMIDEVRISKDARSAGWIATSYNSMNDPASFMTIGTEEEQVGTNADINCEDLIGYDFGQTCIGMCSSEHIWTVTNEGTDPLSGSIELVGYDPGEFAFTQGDGGFALDPNESLIVGVQFCPETLGGKSATLRINSNDPDENPCNVDLSGTGGCGGLNCDDLTDYDWGTIPGECSDSAYWTVINEGDATLNGEVLFADPNEAIFEITQGDGAFALEPAEELTVGVRFCCEAVEPVSAILRINSDDPVEPVCDVDLNGACQGFLVGGAVYTELGNPIGSGEPDVVITVVGDNGTFDTTTAGMQGLWQINDIPPGTYSVDASKLGCTFEQVVGGVAGNPPPIEITVDPYHETENQSIQFLATCTALVPDLNCDNLSEFDFESVNVGDCSSEHTWTITNEGTATLTGSIWLDGTDPEEFEFVEGGGDFTLEPTQSQDIQVRFCPLSVGSKTALLHIVSNDPDENPCNRSLYGTGTGVPDLNCEELAGFDYGSIVVDLCSAEHTWLIENEGNAILSGTISLTGADPNQFEFTQGDGTFDLDPDQTLTVGIRFCPDTTGDKLAELHIDSNDPDENPFSAAIEGQGIPPNVPEINCEDLSDFDFGSKTVGFCTVEQTWTLINEGAANLTGTIFLAGDNAAEFESTRGDGGFGLGPGAQRIIGVRFCPQTTGEKTATLEIESNDSDENPCVFVLSGTGGECVASRDLETLWPSYCDDDIKPVEINLDVPEGANAISLEDQLPAGWTASNISNGGVWDEYFNSVKWSIYGTFPDQVSYDALPPLGTSGIHCFDGVISIDGGADDPICGDECVDGPAGAFIPADSPQLPCPDCGDCGCATCEDRQVEGCESSGYVCAWRSGCNDDMAGAIRGEYIWMHGECYCWGWDDELQQLVWFPSTCPPSAPGCCVGGEMDLGRGGGSAVRDLPDLVQSGIWFPVLIDIQPPPDVSVVALEDQPPAGWLVRSISDNGVWDGIHGKVKWGPYYAQSIPSQVSYELQPPIGAACNYCFVGEVSFDGINELIEGEACVQVNLLGDLDWDGDVDLSDLAQLLAHYNTPSGATYEDGDLNGDGDVDLSDLAGLLGVYGESCP